jgi:hypothetical protein
MLYFILLILLALILAYFNYKKSFEGYSNYILANANGHYPNAQTQVLVQDTYPAIGQNQISNNTAENIWWHYPIFSLGSYDQITNNIKYPNNPDEGTCMPASMCGALYHDKRIGKNYIHPLPPVNPVCGTRVGYYSTNVNLLPYRTDMANILY